MEQVQNTIYDMKIIIKLKHYCDSTNNWTLQYIEKKSLRMRMKIH